MAALGSAAFLLLAPGVMAGLIPWLLPGWDAYDSPAALQIAGWLLIAAGLVALLESFARFALEGRGTPAPVAPTERLTLRERYGREYEEYRRAVPAWLPRR